MSTYSIEYKDEIQRYLDNPTLIIGTEVIEGIEHLTLDKTGVLERKVIQTSLALRHIFMEIFSNAVDGIIKAKRDKIKKREPMYVRVTPEYVLIRNEGVSIPVETIVTKFKEGVKKDVWQPELAFGYFGTSSNYGGDKMPIAGRYGIGAKATNVFSKKFIAIVSDGKKIFRGEWADNMRRKVSMDIHDLDKKKDRKMPYVMIIFYPDFKRLGVKEYDENHIDMFRHLALTASLHLEEEVIFHTPGEEILLTGEESVIPKIISLEYDEELKMIENRMNIKSLADYAKLALPEDVPRARVSVKDQIAVAASMPGEGFQISFVNGALTPDGGAHVDGILLAIGKLFEFEGRDAVRAMSRHITVIVTLKTDKPAFSGARKSRLKGPRKLVKILGEDRKKILKWPIKEILGRERKAIDFRALRKIDGKMKTKVEADKKGRVAKWAGHRDHGHKCTLYIVEGDSAMNLVSKNIAFIAADGKFGGGTEYIGIYPLRGKILNVMKKKPSVVATNKVIQQIVQILGLKFGEKMDKKLSTDAGGKKALRYGRVIIMTDADVDGFHIAALLYVFFYTFFPKLFATGFVSRLSPHIVKADLRGTKKSLRFYREEDYEQWSKKGIAHTAKYFKGLAAYSSEEAKYIFDNPNLIIMPALDDQDRTAIIMAFGKGLADARKRWLGKPIVRRPLDAGPSIKAFIDGDIKDYALSTLFRAIPELQDGFKISKRQILFTFLKYPGSTKKISRFRGNVMDDAFYHHGDGALDEAIKGMAYQHIGFSGNNIPLILNRGQLSDSYTDAVGAARYVEVKLSPIVKSIFRPEDSLLLTPVVVEGHKVQPVTYFPIIPMCLINGTKKGSIAVAYSTFVPPHNPFNIIDHLIWMIKGAKGRQPERLAPWYRGFEGKIFLKEDIWYCEGEFELLRGGRTGDIVITSTPIIIKHTKYIKSVINKLEDEDYIKDSRDQSAEGKGTRIEIYGWATEGKKAMKATYESLKLTRKIPMTNMVLLISGKPRRFDTVEQILSLFYKLRLAAYERRYIAHLALLHSEIDKNNQIIRYSRALKDKKLNPFGWTDEKLYQELKRMKIGEFVLDISVKRLRKSAIEKLLKEIKGFQDQIKFYKEQGPKGLWVSELKHLRQEIKKYYRYLENQMSRKRF